MSDTIKPALTREQWAGLVIDPELGPRIPIMDGSTSLAIPLHSGDYHGLAALCLHEQPFGFSRDDLTALSRVCDDAERWRSSQMYDVEAFRAIRRARDVRDRIAALLPPEGA